MNSPQGIRENFEAAGFNPLLGFYGNGNGTGAQYAPTMGNIIANGMATVGDQIQNQRALEMQKAQLEMENARLQKLTEEQTLRENNPGVYGRNGNSESNNSDMVTDSGIGDTAYLAPGRDVKTEEYSSGAGITEVNNAFTFGSVVVPGADGEPWGLDELATAVIAGGPQVLRNAFIKAWEELPDTIKEHQSSEVLEKWERAAEIARTKENNIPPIGSYRPSLMNPDPGFFYQPTIYDKWADQYGQKHPSLN
jgi:hypothetical protein